jgi:hypothetical protein
MVHKIPSAMAPPLRSAAEGHAEGRDTPDLMDAQTACKGRSIPMEKLDTLVTENGARPRAGYAATVALIA